MATTEQLLAVVKEFNKVLDPDPAFPGNTKSTKAELEEGIKEAASMAEKDDKFSESTIKIMGELGCLPGFLKVVEKNPEKGKPPGVISTIISMLQSGPKSREEILSGLQKAFPERDKKAMASTIQIQVGGRLEKEKGIKVKKDKEGRFFI